MTVFVVKIKNKSKGVSQKEKKKLKMETRKGRIKQHFFYEKIALLLFHQQFFFHFNWRDNNSGESNEIIKFALLYNLYKLHALLLCLHRLAFLVEMQLSNIGRILIFNCFSFVTQPQLFIVSLV